MLNRIATPSFLRVEVRHDPQAVTPERVGGVVLEFEHWYISMKKIVDED